jgi:hypothetical protein
MTGGESSTINIAMVVLTSLVAKPYKPAAQGSLLASKYQFLGVGATAMGAAAPGFVNTA